MTQMTGGHAVVRQLIAEGVDTVFAVPGFQVMHIYDGFYDAPEVRLITCRQEQTAVFAADGYARTTGRPGVAVVVPGPGAYNAGAAMATAMATSSPVLLVSGQIASHELGGGRGSLHEIDDQLDAMAPVTKWNRRAGRAAEIPSLLHEAFRQLKTGRPGPAEVEIPHDFLSARVDRDVIEREEYPRRAPPAERVAQAARLLAGAERPLLWVGDGVVRAGAALDTARLAAALGAPVLQSRDAQGALPDSHPLAFAVPTPAYGDPATGPLVREADVILVVGSRFAKVEAERWDLAPGQQLIHVDIDPAVLRAAYRPDVAMEADAGLALAALNEALEGRAVSAAWDRGRLARAHGERRSRLRNRYPDQARVMEEMREALPDETIIVGGITVGSRWMGSAFEIRRPGTLLSASYMTTLGYAFGAGLGARAGNPDRPVIALCGDGGFMYTVGDLATAVQHGIGLVTLVFNNGVFGASHNDQRGPRFSGRVIGTEFVNPDFVALAESFGVRAERVDALDELPRVVARAAGAGSPALVEVAGDAMVALDHAI